MEDVIPFTMKSDCVFLMIDPTHKYSKLALGNKQFEAMACGRPIICTKGTYSGEFTVKEDVGLAIDYTADALREAIIRLRDDPALRERLGKNGLKAAIEKYNWPTQAEKLITLYESLSSIR
jgi:glycosyltransferase involved in cell wall biosynthesis